MNDERGEGHSADSDPTLTERIRSDFPVLRAHSGARAGLSERNGDHAKAADGSVCAAAIRHE